MKIAALAPLMAALPLTASQPAVVRVGALETVYDPARMTVERFDQGLVLDSDGDWSRASAFVETSETGPCSVDAMRTALGDRGDERGEAGSRVLASGLTLHWATSWTGCRAMTGRPVAACIRHDGVTTRVRGLDLGCRTPRRQHHLILSLLDAARPAGGPDRTGDP